MKKLAPIIPVGLMALMCLIYMICLMSGCQQTNNSVSLYATTEQPFVAKANIPSYKIRFLVLKHCPDDVADTDASEAVRAANLGAQKGLSINTIGNFHIDKEGKTDSWGEAVSLDDLDGLRRFISSQMKVGAESGDTIVIYTIGHGGGNGSLMRLGQRKNLMNAIAMAAEENDQETLWWQLSCHAAASLPEISTLSQRQQELFSMTASSPADELSYFRTQGKQFAALFTAMAEGSSEIDPNHDGIIVAGELKSFMIQKFGRERGELVFARSDDEVIFGFNLANSIPILDRNNPQGEYPRDYIPFPR